MESRGERAPTNKAQPCASDYATICVHGGRQNHGDTAHDERTQNNDDDWQDVVRRIRELEQRGKGLFVLDLELDIVVDEVVHRLAIGRLEDQLALLHDVADDHDELLVGVTPAIADT